MEDLENFKKTSPSSQYKNKVYFQNKKIECIAIRNQSKLGLIFEKEKNIL